MLDEGVQLREAGRREGRDRVCAVRRRSVRVQDRPVAPLRVYDQLHPQAQAPAREIHDELGPRKLHNSTGNDICTLLIVFPLIKCKKGALKSLSVIMDGRDCCALWFSLHAYFII